MKAKSVLFILIAGFLALFACINPIIEELYYIGEEKPAPGTPTLGNPDIEDPPTVTYTVSFDTNGGSPVDCQAVDEGEKATRPENPTRGGYGFVNWYNNEALTKPHYDFDTSVSADMCLYAEWSQIFHTVIFMDGKTEIDNQLVGENGTVSRADPDKDGYTFDGWYIDPELTDVYDLDTPVIIGIILYAKWTLNTYTVTFMDGDRVLSGLIRNAIPHGTAVSRPETDPSKDGHTFDDWYGDAELTDVYDFDTLIKDDTIVYAKFNIKTYTVTFMDGDTVLDGLTRSSVPHGTAVSRPATDPSKDGYTFVNWYSDPGLTVLYDFDAPVTDGFTLYAKWTLNTYTVTFSSNGGSPVDSLTVAEGVTATRPTNPTKDGYTFADWYSDPELTFLYDFDTPVSGGITLYAKWTLKTYTVTFMDGGTVLSALTQTVSHGSTVNRPSDPIKDGYDIFDDWCADSGLVTSFNFSMPIIENKTVYSRWLDSDFPGQTIHNRFNVSNITEWNAARNTISTGGNNRNYIINVIADFNVAGSTDTTFNTASGIKVALRGTGRTLTITGNGNMLRANSGQTLMLRDLILRGNSSNKEPVVSVMGTNSVFIMQSGKICGNSLYGGGVYVDYNGTFTMNGGEISDNIGSNGGGVYVDGGTFTMNGGIIFRNSALYGGGVYVDWGGTFTMNGGNISCNSANNSGGGVYLFCDYGTISTMYGGEISGNTSAALNPNYGHGGGGVCIEGGGGTFRIVTGTIYGFNVADTSLMNYAENFGAALLITGGTVKAEYGKFNGTTWVKSGDLNTTNNTIKVVNGTIINE